MNNKHFVTALDVENGPEQAGRMRTSEKRFVANRSMLSNDFMVKYNTNLGDTKWMNLLSLTNLTVSPYLFLDPAGAGQSMRFYRALMQ